MAFMKPDVQYGSFYDVETTFGREIVPVDVCPGAETVGDLTEYLEGRPFGALCEAPIVSSGWLGRLSAPGYMDCTPWSVYASEEEALEDLLDEEEEETEGERLAAKGACRVEALGRLEAAVRELVSNEHIDLGDLVYKVRASEALGWEGPSVKSWSDAVTQLKDALRELDSHG